MFIDIVSDLICPWCFIGKRRLDQVLATSIGAGVVPRWRPYQLYPNLPADGMDRATLMRMRFGAGAERRGVPQAILDQAASLGIELRYDRVQRVPNTLNGHRLVDWAGTGPTQHALMDTLFRAYFCDGRDLGDLEVLADAAALAGLDRAAALEFLRSDARVDDVRAEIERAYEAGVSGVPSFVLPNGYAVPGAQSAEVLGRIIERAREIDDGPVRIIRDHH
jgi:predicted DsbA family dithiol-disulfide isomerase